MESAALLVELVQAARSAGIELREIPARGALDGEAAARSGVCRVGGRLFALLAPGDPLVDRIDVLARALASLGPQWLEAQYLPPAVRARIEAARDGA